MADRRIYVIIIDIVFTLPITKIEQIYDNEQIHRFILLDYFTPGHFLCRLASLKTGARPSYNSCFSSPPVEAKVPAQQTVGDPALYYNFLMAQIYRSQGDIEGALVHYRAASSLDPDSTVLMFDLANLFVRAGQLEESKQECLKIIERES